jgi:hypothetical protein
MAHALLQGLSVRERPPHRQDGDITPLHGKLFGMFFAYGALANPASCTDRTENGTMFHEAPKPISSRTISL